MKTDKPRTSMNVLVERMEVLYENIYNLLEGFQVASKSTTLTDVNVTLKNEDGTSRVVTINSFHTILQHLNLLDSNFKALTNTNNLSYILDADGQLSQFTKTTFANSPYIDISKIQYPQVAETDFTSLISEMIYPSVRLPITISSEFYQYNTIARIFNITTGFDTIQDGISLVELNQLITNGTVISDPEERHNLQPTKKQVNLFGSFDIISIDSKTSTYTLNSLYYTAINMVGDGNILQSGDILVSDTGASKWHVESISLQDNTVVLTQISGNEQLTTGTKKLFYNQTIDDSTLVVGLPIKPRQQIVVFFSSESRVATSYPSAGIKIDTSDFRVTYNNSIYTIDEFFTDYVTNLSDYLKAMTEEATIPYSMGIQPSTPELLSSNFQVVQINGHITNSSDIAEVNRINTQKQALLNEVESIQQTINSIKANITSNYYKTDKEREAKQAEIIELENKIETINSNILSLSRTINDISLTNAMEDAKAKYKVVGFWHIQDDLYSPSTGVQRIVGYDVQYRYLSPATDVVNNTTLRMVDNGSEVSVVFSAWNDCPTTRLTKRKMADGSVRWEDESIVSVDEININQCMITIKENEAVEIRVRAISEAGYPVSPMKSSWSNIIRVNFPTELKQTSIDGVLQQNEADIRNAEFRQILNNYGILKHINSFLNENGRVFIHQAKDITSGLFTNEMKNIPLDEAMKSLQQRIQDLESRITTKDIVVSVIDFDGKEIEINNNTEIDLYAGRVSEEYDISDPEKFGTILRKKAYIKLYNPNSVSTDIKSLQPLGGGLEEIYTVPVMISDKFAPIQQEGQIIYFRNVDLSLSKNFPLYQDWFQEELKDYPKSEIDGNNTNVLFLNERGEKEIGFADESCSKFAGITIKAPNIYQNVELLKQISLFNRIVSSDKQLNNGLRFFDEMKYACGFYTVGAFLYPILSPIRQYLVKGDSSSSVLVLSAGQEILIPIMFEYRMFDALGRLNGDPKAEFEDLSYTKTIGCSLNITNKPFTFDIKATVKL